MLWLLKLLYDFGKSVNTIKAVSGHVRRHPYIYVGGAASIVACMLAYDIVFSCFIQPARSTVTAFYSAIDNEEYERAWEMLDDDYKKRWSGGFDRFASGYATTVKHTDVDVSDFFILSQLPSAVFSRCMELDVCYRVIDRFDKDTLEDPMQEANLLSLKLRSPSEYRQLVDGTLPNGESTVELTRRFEKTATVSRKRAKWRVSSLQSRSMTFDYR